MSETLLGFCERIINGIGGLRDLERYELAVENVEHDVAVAAWTIRCLANAECEGSGDVLAEISVKRNTRTYADAILIECVECRKPMTKAIYDPDRTDKHGRRWCWWQCSECGYTIDLLNTRVPDPALAEAREIIKEIADEHGPRGFRARAWLDKNGGKG